MNRYRDSGGVVTTLELAKLKSSRALAVNVLQQLVLASGNEEDMIVMLELLQSVQDFEARLTFIQAVITTLKESHRCRTTFRKSGGFVYIVSILLSLDETLGIKDDENDELLEKVLTLIRQVFNCLTTSMRFEPANAKYFQVEIANGVMLLEAVQLLGCFYYNTDEISTTTYNILQDKNVIPENNDIELFERIFSSPLKKIIELKSELKLSHPDLDVTLFNACVVIRMLYDMAIDRYEHENGEVTEKLPKSPRSVENCDVTTTNHSTGAIFCYQLCFCF